MLGTRYYLRVRVRVKVRVRITSYRQNVEDVGIRRESVWDLDYSNCLLINLIKLTH